MGELDYWADSPTTIHAAYCKHCPSHYGPSDPEAEEFAAGDYESRLPHVFPCGWRPSKMCKGVCGAHRITEDDLKLRPALMIRLTETAP